MELLKKLQREGCDLDSVDYLGRGILHIIANSSGHEDIARYLCSQNINLDLLDNKACSALYLAIESDNFATAEILAAHGASLIADNARLAKMLCYIGFHDDVTKLSFLVKGEADVEQADYDKRTIGHLAAAEGNIGVLKYLATNTSFNFDLVDRWDNPVLGELKDENARRQIEELIKLRNLKPQRSQSLTAGQPELSSGSSVNNAN